MGDVVPKCNEMESSFIAYSLLIHYLFYLNIQKLIIENLLIRGGSRGRVQGVPPPPEMTRGFLIQLVFCKKKTMRFIGVGVEQETRVPPPKKNPGSAPAHDLWKRDRAVNYGDKCK